MSDLSSAPIGVFDSGFGGLTVARAIADLLPGEDIVYLADTARGPYGPRPLAEVREFTLQSLDWLAAQGVKALVIACNTGSSAALRDARERYPQLPIIEVVMPAARKAVSVTRDGRVGLICTAATAISGSYNDALEVSPVELVTSVCPKFVPFVEAGVISGDELMAAAEEYLEPLKEQQVDTLVLGCTHYTLLSDVISSIIGDDVALVSSADECAHATLDTLKREGLLRNDGITPRRRFFTTGDPTRFESLGRQLMGGFVQDATQIELGTVTGGSEPTR